MSSNFDSTSSTQSPLDSSKLPMAIATRIPPELLLDIFSTVSDSPRHDYDRYLERNRNLKSFALVHSKWRYRSQEILQEEIYIDTQEEVSVDARLKDTVGKIKVLVDAKIRGTKYLTINGYLDVFLNETESEMWSQIRHLRVWASGSTDGTLSLSELACFPRLREVYLSEPIDDQDPLPGLGYLKVVPSNVRLVFPDLRRVVFETDIEIAALRREDGTWSRADLVTCQSVFSSANMPNLRHLAVYIGLFRPRYTSTTNSLSEFSTLAILSDGKHDHELFRELQAFDKLQHLSIYTDYAIVPHLFDVGKLSLESLHLDCWLLSREQELLPRLVRIAKGRDPMVRIKRIVIYGSRNGLEARTEDLTDAFEAFEWREGQQSAPFEDFDGR